MRLRTRILAAVFLANTGWILYAGYTDTQKGINNTGSTFSWLAFVDLFLFPAVLWLALRDRAERRERHMSTSINEISAMTEALAEQQGTEVGHEPPAASAEGTTNPLSPPPTLSDEPKDQDKLAASAMAMQLLSDEDLHEQHLGWFPGKVPGQESALSILHEHSEHERQILEEAQTPLNPPPTPEEVHEAEMNPWPGHTMRETILRNRGQIQSPPSTPPQQPPPQDTNLPPQ